jgi:hypothetical protein
MYHGNKKSTFARAEAFTHLNHSTCLHYVYLVVYIRYDVNLDKVFLLLW